MDNFKFGALRDMVLATYAQQKLFWQAGKIPDCTILISKAILMTSKVKSYILLQSVVITNMVPADGLSHLI